MRELSLYVLHTLVSFVLPNQALSKWDLHP